MPRLLVILMSCASLLSGCDEARAEASAPMLAQEDLEVPEVVTAWLKAHASSADRKTEERFLQMASASARQRSWGAAAKGFVESALHFPAPLALRGYAEAALHVYGPVRARTGETFKEKADLARALRILDSAAASDVVLNELGAGGKRALEHDRTCLRSFLDDKLSPADAANCAPLIASRNLNR